MSEHYEVVERPDRYKSSAAKRFIAALEQTMVDGQALRVPCTGESIANVRNRLASRLRDANMPIRLRSRVDGDALVVWGEKKQ